MFCLQVSMCPCLCLYEVRRDTSSPWTRVTDRRELPSGTENWTWILWKSSWRYWPLSHLSCFSSYFLLPIVFVGVLQFLCLVFKARYSVLLDPLRRWGFPSNFLFELLLLFLHFHFYILHWLAILVCLLVFSWNSFWSMWLLWVLWTFV